MAALAPLAGLAASAALFFVGQPPLIAIGAGLAVFAVVQVAIKKGRAPVLHASEWRDFPLTEKIQLSSNTALYRFSLPSPSDSLNLPIGQHISLCGYIDGKECFRSYTPTTLNDTLGHFDLVVKAYPQGNMSKYLDEMKIGQTIKVRGPKGAFKYEKGMVDAFGMVAGGTGITPMYQVALASLRDPTDKTKFRLIYANNTEADILLRDELDGLAKKYPERFSVYYVLLEASLGVVPQTPANWTQGKGFVTSEMMQKHLPPYSSRSKLLVCGPPPMLKAVCGHAEGLGWPAARALSKAEDAVFRF